MTQAEIEEAQAKWMFIAGAQGMATILLTILGERGFPAPKDVQPLIEQYWKDLIVNNNELPKPMEHGALKKYVEKIVNNG